MEKPTASPLSSFTTFKTLAPLHREKPVTSGVILNPKYPAK